MNWNAIGAIGEIVGAVAVVVTLLYLSVQVRNSNKATRIASVQALVESMNSIWADFQTDNDALSMLRRNVDGEELTGLDQTRMGVVLTRTLNHQQMAFLMHEEGVLSDDVFDALCTRRVRELRELVSDIDEKWARTRPRYTLRFAEWFEAMLEIGDA